MLDRRKPILGLVLSLLAAGCAVQQKVDPAAAVQKLGRDDMKYLAVQVEPFTIGPKGVKEKDPEAYTRKALDTCVRVLERSGLFESVAAGPAADAPDGALLVRGELVGLRIVTAGQHKWLGGLVGRSQMKVRVTLADAGTGNVLRSLLVEQDDETAAGPWSMGATDRSLPAEVGTRIAEAAAAGARK